jgi:hypothetical protein
MIFCECELNCRSRTCSMNLILRKQKTLSRLLLCACRYDRSCSYRHRQVWRCSWNTLCVSAREACFLRDKQPGRKTDHPFPCNAIVRLIRGAVPPCPFTTSWYARLFSACFCVHIWSTCNESYVSVTSWYHLLSLFYFGIVISEFAHLRPVCSGSILLFLLLPACYGQGQLCLYLEVIFLFQKFR